MLSYLKRNIQKKNVSNPVLGFAPKPFNPLNLPNYLAGYLMNRTTDVPPGSINPVLVSAQWFDGIVLGIGSKYYQSPGSTVLTLLNGFNAITFDAVNIRYRNIPFDIFNGITDYTCLIGFKRGDNGANSNFLTFQTNAIANQLSFIIMRPGGFIQGLMGDGVPAHDVQVTTTNIYDDDVPHCVIVSFSQSTKTIRLFTDLGENLTFTNALYIANLMTAGDFNQIQLGNWNNSNLSYQPGLFGDVLYLNTAVSNLNLINQLMAWECNRLAIPYVTF